MPYGVMGGRFQPTGQTLFLTNHFEFGLDVQEAIDHPRLMPQDGKVQVETGIPGQVVDRLNRLGHPCELVDNAAWRRPGDLHRPREGLPGGWVGPAQGWLRDGLLSRPAWRCAPSRRPHHRNRCRCHRECGECGTRAGRWRLRRHLRAAGEDDLAAACAPLAPCPTGQARVTPGFRLEARHVIHAVGPAWQGGEAGEAALLAGCYRASLALLRAAGGRSIAFPAISTGIYGYPARRRDAHRRRETVRDDIARHGEADVLFACFGQAILALYQKELAMTQPCDLDATDARELIGARSSPPSNCWTVASPASRAVDHAVNAMVARDDARARAAAKAAEAGGDAGGPTRPPARAAGRHQGPGGRRGPAHHLWQPDLPRLRARRPTRAMVANRARGRRGSCWARPTRRNSAPAPTRATPSMASTGNPFDPIEVGRRAPPAGRASRSPAGMVPICAGSDTGG